MRKKMKTYKDFEKIFIGNSDIGTLILAGFVDGKGIVTDKLIFRHDDFYYAYVVYEKDVQIGEYYHDVARFNYWVRIYDDNGLGKEFEADKIIIWRDEEIGCIIQLIGRECL